MPSGTRVRNIFDPASEEPFKLSRSKIELFLQCPRCFYLDRRLGVGRPDTPPYTLNNAVDHLLKKEFDMHRAKGSSHPLMTTYGVDAVPFQHPEMDAWRDALRGIQYHHRDTNFLVFGAVDDVWVDEKGRLIIVDYKATSTAKTISLDDEWKAAYKRQVEVYQWLFRRNGFEVLDTAYFVFVNAEKDRQAFDRKLEFSVQILPHRGAADWVDDALTEARICLERETAPPAARACEWCAYRKAAHIQAGGEGGI